MWLQAFDEDNRSVQTLIRQFIKGLKSAKLQEKLITREGGPPDNYAELRDLAVTLSGQLESMKHMRDDRKAKKAPPFKMGGNRGGPTPMDVNAAGAGKGKKNGGGVMNVNPPQGNPGGKAAAGKAGNQKGRQPFDKSKCLNCGGTGHWRDACPSPKKKGSGQGGPVMNVEAEGEDAEADTDEEDDDDPEAFVNCAELSGAGNGTGQA